MIPAPPSATTSAAQSDLIHALSATQADLQALIDATPGVSLLFTLAGELLCVNARAETHFGRPREQLIGHDLYQLFPPKVSEVRRQAVARAVAQRERLVLEDARDGLVFRNTIVPVIDADGHIRRAAVFAEDITAERLHEQRLLESEERYRLLAENSQDVIWTLDLKSRRFTYISPSVERLRGMSVEEVMAEPMEAAMTPDSLIRVQAAMSQMLARIAAGERTQLTNVAEVSQPHRDGRVIDTEVVTTYLLDAEGRPATLLGVTRDITPRRQAERALRDSEEKFRFLAENTADVVWQLDNRLGITYINAADEKLRGFQREEVLGRSVLELFTPEGRAIVLDVLRQWTAQPHGPLRFEAPQLRKDGSQVWVEVSSTPIVNALGVVTGSNGITRDITERRRQQVTLEESHLQLERKLAEVTELQTRLREQALRDPLTGVYNRRYLDETLPRELSRAKREGYPLAVIMLDLDHFKHINDTYGHPAGDDVIVALAGIISAHTRKSDVICRYGGEEFLAVLPRMTLAQAEERAQRWRLAMMGTEVRHGEFVMTATLSAGVAAFPESGAEVDQLLLHADSALYQAKNEGRNRVVQYRLPG